MITGRHDVYLTVSEFADMIGRSEKTIRNWVSEGRLTAIHLCGVPLIAMSHIETLIAGVPPATAAGGKRALELSHHMTLDGKRAVPERRTKEKTNG